MAGPSRSKYGYHAFFLQILILYERPRSQSQSIYRFLLKYIIYIIYFISRLKSVIEVDGHNY